MCLTGLEYSAYLPDLRRGKFRAGRSVITSGNCRFCAGFSSQYLHMFFCGALDFFHHDWNGPQIVQATAEPIRPRSHLRDVLVRVAVLCN